METIFLWLLLGATFVFGSMVGSFLNVLLFRYNTGRTLWGRSSCLSCGQRLSALQLVPIFSFLFLRGRCHACSSRFSWQYPSLEFLTGLLFAGVFYKHLPLELSLGTFLVIVSELVAFSTLLFVLVYDLRHKIIPDSFSAVFALAAIASHAFKGETLEPFVLAGILFFIPFYLLWKLSGGRLMGLGDGKLALGIGFLLGPQAGFSAIVSAFWIGALLSLGFLILSRLSGRLSLGAETLTMKSEVPFAPFLICGVFLVFFFGVDVFDMVNTLLLSPWYVFKI